MPTGFNQNDTPSYVNPADYAKQQAEGKKKDKLEREESSWRRGLRRMDESDAYELNEDALANASKFSKFLDEERHILRVKVVSLSVALVVVLALSLCVTVNYYKLIAPDEVLGCIALWFQVQFTNLFTTEIPLNTSQIMELQPYYYEVTARFSISVLTALCGGMLAVAGALYQNVFKNPIAAPTMLGVQSGVNVGLVVLVLLFNESALYMTGARYALCYGGSILVLLVVLGAGRLISGGRNFNVVNMLLIGSVISQMTGLFITYATSYMMGDEAYEVYFELQEQLSVDASGVSWIAVIVVLVIAAIPIVLFNFSLNALSFTDDDSRLLGVNPNVLRIVSLVSGSLMVTAAMVYSGQVAMVSLLIPHLSRFLFGAEFKKQMLGSALLGALLLLVCRDISALIPFVDAGLPIGTVVSLVTLPFFVWMLAVQQRSWE